MNNSKELIDTVLKLQKQVTELDNNLATSDAMCRGLGLSDESYDRFADRKEDVALHLYQVNVDLQDMMKCLLDAVL